MRSSVLAGVGLVPPILLTILVGASPPTLGQTPAGQRWEYGESVSVRLRIRSEPPLAGVATVRCVVEGPLRPSQGTGVRSTTEREFRGAEFVIYFPEDFARRAQPGKYTWTCLVEDRVTASGSFEYLSEDAAKVGATQ